MNEIIKEILIPVPRKETLDGTVKSYNIYDPNLYKVIKEIAAKEGITISGMIHRAFEMIEREYYEQK